MEALKQVVDLSSIKFWRSAASICFNPLFWNWAARCEHRNHSITKMAGGNARYGCLALAVVIFSLGLVRDTWYQDALNAQPRVEWLSGSLWTYIGVACITWGQILVVTALYQLGIVGTYLGDYFGILMEDRVTAFPFSVSANPMYRGSTLSFLGVALLRGKPAGLVLSALVHVVYNIALEFEEPFTAEIYAKRDRARNKSE